MRELIKAMFRFSWAASMFGVRQAQALVDGSGKGPMNSWAEAFEHVGRAASAELTGPFRGMVAGGAGMQTVSSTGAAMPQRQTPPPTPASAYPDLDARLAAMRVTPSTPTSPSAPPSRSGAPSTSPSPSCPILSGRLNTTSFVVLGEGLAAGMGDFSLSRDSQTTSFPALLAAQIGAQLQQPLFEPPGIGEAVGFAPWPVIVPSPLQSTVLDKVPGDIPRNLSVPGFTVCDALHARPSQPLIQRGCAKQTALNLILGIRDLALGTKDPLPTQLECAVAQQPTFALVELGYGEALAAAVWRDTCHLPRPEALEKDYCQIVRELKNAGADVLVLTVPNPFDTAYFSDIQTAARVVKLDPELLLELWHLQPDDRITVPGLGEIAFQLYAASIGPSTGSAIQPLPPDCVVPAACAAEIQSALQMINETIRRVASAESAIVYDLCSLFCRLRSGGIPAGKRRLTGDYLGGFYALNGYYPGATGNALIANEILDLLNHAFSAGFAPIDLAQVQAADPVANYQPAQGPNWTRRDLTSPSALPMPPAPPLPTPQTPAPSVPYTDTSRGGWALQLPPSLEQVLPVNCKLSYFGDAISAQNCRTPQTIQWGSGGNLLFGGLAMVDSHLSGNIRLKFSPPAGEWTTFELSFEPGLSGTDATLGAPAFFRMPAKQQLVGNVPGKVSSGRLNLKTGQIDPTSGTFNLYVAFFNSALFALLAVNPKFPTDPLSFPGPYGSACVKFEQRPDGKLDLTFSGSTFVPLGAGTAFPLTFSGPSRQFACIPAAGSVLHPHLSFTTRETPPAPKETAPPEIPVNTLQELTLFTPVSSFGDKFTLNAEPLGGPALGRSHLLGRAQIQFGPRSGDLVPIALSTAMAGGVLAPLAPTPIAQLFPGRLTPGPEGFDSTLRFPLRSYSLNDLAVIDDPFDLSVGAINACTGELIHPLLHRGFINQDLIFALLRVEPRTPTNSFFFRGPGKLASGPDRKAFFQYFGQVHIPYPPGFLFPDPNLATGFPVTGGGSLDPYLWVWAFQDSDAGELVKTGKGERVLSHRGELFSYRFVLPARSSKRRAEFEYENHSQNGKFRMHSLSWIGFGNSNTGAADCDVVSFSGFGVWTQGGVEKVVQASGQISTSPVVPYVGFQIAQAEISDADTPIPPSQFPIPEPDLTAAVCVVGVPPSPPSAPPSGVR